MDVKDEDEEDVFPTEEFCLCRAVYYADVFGGRGRIRLRRTS